MFALPEDGNYDVAGRLRLLRMFVGALAAKGGGAI